MDGNGSHIRRTASVLPAADRDHGSIFMADVFISYSKERRRLTTRLADELGNAGFTVWWDAGLLPNQSFRAEIDAQLDTCKATVIVWSPESVRSDWVLAEAEHARAQGKLVNAFAPDLDPAAIPKPFNQTHAVPLHDLPAVVAAIEALTGLQRKPDWRPRPRARRKAALTAAAAGLGLLVAGAGFSLWQPGRGVPAPSWDLARATFVGERALLKWNYDHAGTAAGAGRPASTFFALESSHDAHFSKPTPHPELVNGAYAYVSGANAALFWRVRAVDPRDRRAISGWSAVTRVGQYDSAHDRMTVTGQALVFVSNSEYQDVFKWIDGSARLRGLDLAVARAVVERLPVRTGPGTALKAEVVPVAWSELLDAPRLGRADLVVSAISRRKVREDTFGLVFSSPYFCTTQSLLHRPGDPGQRVGVLLQGGIIGYQKNTTSEQLALGLSRDVRLDIKSAPFERTDFVVDALLSSRVKSAIVDTPFAIDAVRSARDKGQMLAFTEFRPEDIPDSLPDDVRTDEYAIGIRAGEHRLVQEIDGILAAMKSSGELAKLFALEIDDYIRLKGARIDPVTEARLRSRPWECPG
jgi:ABC-type amino acid transport substrate-binding protein